MKKVILLLVLALSQIFVCSVNADEYSSFSTDVFLNVNGDATADFSECVPVIINDRSFANAGILLRMFGFEVTEQDDNTGFVVTDGGSSKQYALTVDSTSVIITNSDGTTQSYDLLIAPKLYNNELYVPLRPMESLFPDKIQISWDDAARAVLISFKKNETSVDIDPHLIKTVTDTSSKNINNETYSRKIENDDLTKIQIFNDEYAFPITFDELLNRGWSLDNITIFTVEANRPAFLNFSKNGVKMAFKIYNSTGANTSIDQCKVVGISSFINEVDINGKVFLPLGLEVGMSRSDAFELVRSKGYEIKHIYDGFYIDKDTIVDIENNAGVEMSLGFDANDCICNVFYSKVEIL